MSVLKDQFEIEKWAEEVWREVDWEVVREKNVGSRRMNLLDGPPFLTGSAHLGHVFNKTIKDAFYRFFLMEGDDVDHQWGWDSQGLPIEKKVEERLGIQNKGEIEEIGIDAFNEACKQYIEEVRQRMTGQFEDNSSFLANPDDYYITCSDDYIEYVWRLIKAASEKGLLYRGRKVLPYCPTCETTLAATEMEYENRRGTGVYFKLPVVNDPERYFVVWTTTPWTIKGNTNIAVNPDGEYIEVRMGQETWIVGKKQFESLKQRFDLPEDIEIVREMNGRELEGLKYENRVQRNPRGRPKKNFHTVVAADFVGDEGTGIVHIAPSHGPEDYVLGRRLELKQLPVLDDSGRYNVRGYEGLSLNEVNERVVQELYETGLLVVEENIEHSIGTCWRCHTPTVYLPSKQLFLRVSRLKKQLKRLTDKIEITPEQGRKRFKNWLENIEDWCITRQRYWGSPVPIWTCGSCKNERVVGSTDELRDLYGKDLPKNFELHRPYVDEIVLACDRCGHEMYRLSDVLDVWLDSGVAFLTLDNDVADRIIEGYDQTRGWFYSMLVAGKILGIEPPYKHVTIHGFIVDENGEKMSKSKGNVIEPGDIHHGFAKDILRYYSLSHATYSDFRFNLHELKDINRLFNTLVNSFYFAMTYMELDEYRRSENAPDFPEDAWLISRKDRLIADVTDAINNDSFDKAAKRIASFITEDLSRWYIPLIREAVWDSDPRNERKLSAYATLDEVFDDLSRILVPFAPQTAEYMYHTLGRFGDKERASTVQMEYWPKPEKMDRRLEAAMDITRSITSDIYALRSRIGAKRRQPLQRAYIVTEDDSTRENIHGLSYIIKNMGNLKEVEIMDSEEELNDEERYVRISRPGYILYLDTEIPENLLLEGYTADVRRGIQALRRDAGYGIMDTTTAIIEGEGVDMLQAYLPEIEEVTRAEIRTGEIPEDYMTTTVKTYYGSVRIGIPKHEDSI
jgi:isoleucyl-tRNA synthetase